MFTIGENGKSFSEKIIDLVREQWRNEEIKAYIQHMNPSELVDDSKTTLLHVAAKYNNWSLAKHLIEIGCDVNAETTSKTTPLMVAAEYSNGYIATILIKAKADIYAKNLSGKSALQLLLNNKNMDRYDIKNFLERVKCDALSDKLVADILYAAKCPISVAACCSAGIKEMIINNYISELSKPGVKINISNPDNILFLSEMHPSDEDCLPLLSIFLEKVTDWNTLTEKGLECLELFFLRGSKKIVELFLQHNVNDYVKNKFPGQDLFINIFGNNNADARKLLKILTFDINSCNSEGSTALHFAIDTENASVDIVQTLLDLGADPNIKKKFEGVPLSVVHKDKPRFNKVNLNSKERQIIELLLLYGADPQLDIIADYNYFFTYSSLIHRELVMAQLAIDNSLGKPIRKNIPAHIDYNYQFRDMYERYRRQLDQLKSVSVHGLLTLYNVLVIDPTRIADCLKNPEALQALQAIIMSNDMGQYHFYYVSKLENSQNQILHAMDLKMKASMFICEITGWPSSQYIVIEKIISFLTYKELRVFDKLDCQEK